MDVIINIIIGLVSLLHLLFLFVEMFLWTKPIGLKIFGQSLERAKASAALAANQGLYNGFLAAGLIWGLFQSDPLFSKQIKLFFLACVIVAGVYGAITVNKRILIVQALPALIACLLLLVF